MDGVRITNRFECFVIPRILKVPSGQAGVAEITQDSGVNQLSKHGERIVVPERRQSQIVTGLGK